MTKGKKRLFVTIVSVFLCACMLFAGGSKEDDGRQKITFLTLDAVNFRGQLEQFIEEFNAANPEYYVEATFAPDVEQLFVAGLQTGKSFDISFVISNAVTPYLESGKLGEVPDWFLEKHRDEFYDYSFDALVSSDGAVHGIPYNYFPSWGQIMINVDLWEEAGVDPTQAKTWDEFMELCKKVTKYDQSGRMIQAGFSAQRDEEVYFINRVLQLGGVPYNSDGSAAFDNEVGMKALQNYVDIFNTYGVDDMELGETIDSFRRGAVASMNGMPWFGAILDNDLPDLNYAFIDCPEMDELPNTWGLFQVWSHIVSKEAEDKEGVWAFLEYLIAPENTVRWSKFCGELSAVKSTQENPEIINDRLLAPFVEAMDLGVAGDVTLYTSEDVRDAIKDMLRSVVDGLVTPEEGLKAGAEEITRLNSVH